MSGEQHRRLRSMLAEAAFVSWVENLSFEDAVALLDEYDAVVVERDGAVKRGQMVLEAKNALVGTKDAEILKLRKILAHVPASVALEAKEAAGYGEYVSGRSPGDPLFDGAEESRAAAEHDDATADWPQAAKDAKIL